MAAIDTISIGILLLATILNIESSFDMRFQKCSCIVHDPNTVQNVSCFARSVNRTTTLINMRGNIIRQVKDVYVNIQMLKRTEITYRPFLINSTDSYCDFFGKNRASTYLRMFARQFLSYTNLNHSCPFFGLVYIKDFPLIGERFPSIWPPGNYKVIVLAFEKFLDIITMNFFLEIKENRPKFL